MSNLISRETVISTIHNYFKSLIDKTIFDINVVDCAKGVSEAIDSIPTAYDVDKVVEQLEKERDLSLKSTGKYYHKPLVRAHYQNAISIVKGGGQG